MRTELAIGVHRTVAWKRTTLIASCLFIPCLSFVARSSPQENCCQRDVYTAPFTMPAGDSEKWGGFASGDATSPLFRGTLQGSACPLEVWITGRKANPDYRFEGVVTTEGLVQTDDVGHLHGTFVAKLRLVDPDHDNAVLREATVTWRGTLTDGFNQKVYKYEPSTNSLNPSWQDRTGELGKQFFDIQDLIYNYEGKPQKCAVSIPEGNESVESGKTITINLVDVIDHQGRRPPAWQRVLVKVEKGKILNADEKWDDFYVFKVRASGGLAVQYQAPDDCKPGKETLTVWNTCSKRKDGSDRSGGNFQLAKKEFNIVCDQYEVKLTYEESLNDQEGTVGGMRRTVGHTYSATAKARVTFASADRLEAIYESKSTQLDLNDSFNQHWIAEMKDLRCDARISWTGTHNGDYPAKLIVKFNTHGRHYAVGWGKGGGQVTYRVALNLYGDDRCGAARAWQGEGPVKAPLPPTGKPGQPSPSYTLGQNPPPVQLSWTDNLVLVDPGRLPYPDIKQFSGPMWAPLVALSRVGWPSGGKAIVNHTLSIEVKRPQ